MQYFRIAAASLVALSLAGAGKPAHASRAASISGVWNVAVTLVDCNSGAPLAPSFTSLLSFAGNGTESEATNNPALQPGQRSTAYGVWTGSVGKYHMNSYALILFSTNGTHPIEAGSQTIHQDITLSGNTWTSTATIQFYDLKGNPLQSGCATAAATRLT